MNTTENPKIKQVFAQLQKIIKNAYVPYSRFCCAAICEQNGKFFYGVNIENASYPVGVCAEKSAISALVSSGHQQLEYIYVFTDKDFGSPCGNCRQFISEFIVDWNEKRIFLFNSKGEYKAYTMADLLPLGFQPEDLKK